MQDAGITIVFRTHDRGELRAITFRYRPLGMDFDQLLPITIRTVTGQAAQLGVQAGWVIKALNEVDLDGRRLSFADVSGIFQSKIARLPSGEQQPEQLVPNFDAYEEADRGHFIHSVDPSVGHSSARSLYSARSTPPGRLPGLFEAIAPDVEARIGRALLMGRYHVLPRVVHDDYDVTDHVVGHGYSGKILLANCRHEQPYRESMGRYAVKTLRLHNITVAQRSKVEAEVKVFLCTDHPNIARLCDVYETDTSLTLVMDYMEGGELYEHISRTRAGLPESDTADAVQQLLLALGYLHSHGIVHRDVKLENVVYDHPEGGDVKLIDFGLSTFHDPSSAPLLLQCGTVEYAAPELLTGRYSSQCDLWGLGVVTFIALSGVMPFQGPEAQVRKKVVAGRYSMQPAQWQNVSQEAQGFIEALLQTDPQRRLTAQAALGHPWVMRSRAAARAVAAVEPFVVAALKAFPDTPRFERCCLSLLGLALPSEGRAHFRDHFATLEKSGRGTISLQELLDVMPTESQREVARIFSALTGVRCSGAVGEGEIHFSDFLAAMVATHVRLSEELLHAAFRKLDAGSSGVITPSGLRGVFGSTLEGRNVESLVWEATPRNGGPITFAEFARLLRESQKTSGQRQAAALDSTGTRSRQDWQELDFARDQDPKDVCSRHGEHPNPAGAERSCYTSECAVQ